MKICCCTGHREIPDDKIEFVKQELSREILLAVKEGYTHFISGMARGTDLYFAEIVAELRKENESLHLEAALPYRARVKAKDKMFREVLNQCTEIGILSEAYNPGVFMKRNRWMVTESQRVIAVYDGRERGGTAQTMRLASAQGLEVRIIEI